ncbi:hypothetical protein [Endozoicomonas sp. SCSIO W0465]|uniref:hypothetical protein n=1 Tax=Endozoicomonas sp. SCSIO W0465 TaxID=2918516 RepID=UPI0020753CEB|nr:hypothetical protein [Endozoicomonas sp. SCSIO W0465]USE36941.1 hypothetical protein MJO57_01475 [Endozoicomonas sp. SCSIO W0465]
MDRPTCSQLSPAPNGLSNIQGMSLAESGATGHAFSRMVTEFGQPVTSYDNTDQSTSSDNQGYLNPKIKWLKGFAVQNQTGYKDSPAIPVAIPLENYQVVEHDPENNTFSIYSLTKRVQSTSQSSTEVDTKPNPPIQIPNQDGIVNYSKSTVPTVIFNPRLKSEHHQQYTSPAIQAEEAIVENPSHIECKRELREESAYVERNRVRNRELKRELRKDPARAERERVRNRERQRERRKDPAYAERERERERKRQRELRKDPAYVEREKEQERKRQRERRKDPAFAERERVRNRERQRELRKDPAHAKRERERKRERHRKRYQTDPAYAERERERKKRYRQSVNSAKNSGDLPLTSNLTERTRSSSKNLEGTAPPFSVVKLKEYLQSPDQPREQTDS